MNLIDYLESDANKLPFTHGKTMNLYHVWRSDSWDYDDFDSFVCIAETEAQAREIHPSDYRPLEEWKRYSDTGWVRYQDRDKLLNVDYLGIADASLGTEPAVICSSFNAG